MIKRYDGNKNIFKAIKKGAFTHFIFFFNLTICAQKSKILTKKLSTQRNFIKKVRNNYLVRRSQVFISFHLITVCNKNRLKKG